MGMKVHYLMIKDDGRTWANIKRQGDDNVDKAVIMVKKTKNFDKLVKEQKVLFAGEVFGGTKAEYIAKIEREKESTFTRSAANASLDDNMKKLTDLGKTLGEDYDQLAFSAHGLFDKDHKWTGKAEVGGVRYDQSIVDKRVQATYAGTILFASCGYGFKGQPDHIGQQDISVHKKPWMVTRWYEIMEEDGEKKKVRCKGLKFRPWILKKSVTDKDGNWRDAK